MPLMSNPSSHSRTFPSGTVLFREGEPGSEMFVIQRGRVQLTRRVGKDETVLAELPAGEFFGEMAIVNNRPRSATATVTEEATMLVLDAKTFETMIRESTEIAVRLIRKLAGRLEQANQQIEVMLLRDSNHRVVHTLRKLSETSGTPDEAGVRVQISIEDLSARVGMPVHEVQEILARLQQARLVRPLPQGQGFVVAEGGRLQDFLDFLEMKERYGRR
jgi:CRP-like cAMP-binding protein